MANETIKIPDLGGADGVEIIEVSVAVGDTIAAEDSLLVLESDKASMEVPAPKAGKISKILVNVGDTVSEGDDMFEIEIESAGEDEPATDDAGDEEEKEEEKEQGEVEEDEKASSDDQGEKAEQSKAASDKPKSRSVRKIEVPDIGGEAELIELCVAEGDEVEEGDSLVVLESDKASMEVPSPYTGVIRNFKLKVGDSVAKGSLLGEIEVQAEPEAKPDAASADDHDSTPASEPEAKEPEAKSEKTADSGDDSFQSSNPAMAKGSEAVSGPTVETHPGVYAGPAVRKMAREFSIPLEEVKGSGPRGRIVKEDLQAYVKTLTESDGAGSGSGLPVIPDVDFAQFGSVKLEARSKLAKLTAKNMHRSWVNLPHVTQFDETDITELEDFRKSLKAEAEQRGVKITPLPFLLKAAAAALRAHPQFNVSLSNDGEDIIYKDYVHIGIAVDTPAGLVVPVLRDVDKKSIWDLAAETAELAQKAKDRKLRPADMQGGCFTISSLGGIGGTGFTPIINAPEVAILGVSKLAVKPVWDGESFQPRKMLPLSLSYDHRAINGADAGQFLTELNRLLADIRRLAL